jgi:UDP-glucose 4-epimerase
LKKPMKILITGSGGFAARNIHEQLKDVYTVVPQNSKELNLLDACRVSDFLKNGKFDAVLHTATHDPAPRYSTKDPSKVLENNLKMFFNVARCREHFGKLIYFGSGAEFDREQWAPKMREDYFDCHVPADQYGFSKYVMTKYALSESGIYNLRMFSVFGKYEDWRYRFISRACCCALSGVPVTVSQNVYFDYTYIDDFVRIVKWFIENEPKHKAYNVCSGDVYEYGELAEKIGEISGRKPEIIAKHGGFRKEYSGDNSRLMSEIKGFTFTPIDESIKALYRWYETNKNSIDPKEL